MKSSLFQFYLFEMQSTGAAEGIDGEKKIENSMWDLGYRCRVLYITTELVPSYQ